jgi:lysine-specific demethylase/histidyl-hydroxylase NO66
MITEPGLRRPGFRLAKAGEKLATSAYSGDISWRPEPFTGVANVPRVVDEVGRGATVVLQGLHLTTHPLAVYCRELEARLGHPVQANAYLTPRQSQGLPVHHDTHDVFVLQVAGTKRWLVYDPVLELPLREQRYDPELGAPGETVLDVVLGPGDTLYLPRGWLHQALTSDEDSLHLTIGVNVVPWIAALRAAVDRCADDVEFRRSVPADGRGGEELLERLAARLDPAEVAAAARERFVRTRRPIRERGLAELRALDELAAGTRVERRETVIADLTETPDGRALALAFEGKHVRFPQFVRPELEYLLGATEPFAVDELPGGLDEAGRLVLVRRLVREGFLRLVE